MNCFIEKKSSNNTTYSQDIYLTFKFMKIIDHPFLCLLCFDFDFSILLVSTLLDFEETLFFFLELFPNLAPSLTVCCIECVTLRLFLSSFFFLFDDFSRFFFSELPLRKATLFLLLFLLLLLFFLELETRDLDLDFDFDFDFDAVLDFFVDLEGVFESAVIFPFLDYLTFLSFCYFSFFSSFSFLDNFLWLVVDLLRDFLLL